VGEDLGEVHGFQRFALAVEKALDLHEATGVIRNDILGFGLYSRSAFDFAHRGGDCGKFGGKGAPKAATGLGITHLDEFESLDVLEKTARLLFHFQLAEAVAAVVRRRR